MRVWQGGQCNTCYPGYSRILGYLWEERAPDNREEEIQSLVSLLDLVPEFLLRQRIGKYELFCISTPFCLWMWW